MKLSVIMSWSLFLFLTTYSNVQAQTPAVSKNISNALTTGYFSPNLTVDHQGNINVLTSYGDYSLAIAKYNPKGILLKQFRIGDMATSQNIFAHYLGYLLMDENENYYILGTDYKNSHSFELQKKDSTGKKLWSYLYQGSNLTYTVSSTMTQDASGNIFIMGYFTTTNSQVDSTFITKLNKNGIVKWSKAYAPITPYYGIFYTKMIVDPKGNVFATGVASEASTYDNKDMATQKFDKKGNLLWSQTYGRPDSNGARWDQSYDIAVAPSGNIYITGQSERDSVCMTTINYDKNGNLKWANLYHGPGLNNTGQQPLGLRIFLDASEHIYTAGLSADDFNEVGLTEISYNPNGQQRWGSVYPNSDFIDAAFDSAQNTYLLSFDDSGNFGHEVLVAYDKNGNQKFSQEYDPDAKFTEFPNAISLASDGNIYTTGSGYNPVDLMPSTYLMKHASGGNLIWKENYQVPVPGLEYHKSILMNDSLNFFSGITMDSVVDLYPNRSLYLYQYDSTAALLNTVKYQSGVMNRVVRDQQKDIIICGFTSSKTSQPLLIVCDPFGKKRFNIVINENPNGKSYAIDANSDPSGNIYLTGYWKTANGNDIFIYKFDANGNKVWSHTYNGSGNANDEAYALSIDNSGAVFITGRTQTGSTYQPLLLKYDADGNLVWSLIPVSQNNAADFGYELLADNTGGCFVTGRYTQNSTKQGFAVIKVGTNGNVKWISYRQDPEQNTSDFGTHLMQDANGNIFAEGRVMKNGTPYGISIIKYNQNGNALWSFEQPGYNYAFDDSVGTTISYNDPLQFAMDANQNVYVANVMNISFNVQIYKLNKNGVQQWLYTSPVLNPFIQPSPNIITDNSGNLLCLFNIYSDSLTTYDWRLLRFTNSSMPQIEERKPGLLSIAKNKNPILLSVFPQPAEKKVQVTFRNFQPGSLNIIIRDAFGQVVYQDETQIDATILQKNIDVEKFIPGWFTIQVINNHQQVSCKMLKE